MRLGYCTNVHAGTSLPEALEQLEHHAAAVRQRLNLEVLPIGLWLPASAMHDVDAAALQTQLAALGLQAFTMNAFPLGDFHGDVVKDGVYTPDWTTSDRMHYTMDTATLLADLLEPGGSGSVSTLPLGWRPHMDDDAIDAACDQLVHVVRDLAALEQRTGRCIHLGIEPEPGCVLGTLGELAHCFETKMLGPGEDELVRRHLRACVDLCHAAVMFEALEPALDRFDDIGLQIGKVQVSSAVEIDFDAIDPSDRLQATKALSDFNEPRWMHQTTIQRDGAVHLFNDLDEALRQDARGYWRTHFHVPVHAERLGIVGTTQHRLERDITLLLQREDASDWEVETYAWDALPAHQRSTALSESIAHELQWTQKRLDGGAA